MRPLADRAWFAPVMAPLIVGAVLLGVWEFCCGHFQIPLYLFPAPSDIAKSLVENWPAVAARVGQHAADHLRGVRAGDVLGVLTAFLFIQSRWIEMSLLPYAVLLQVTPIVAVAPLIIILVKNTPLALTAVRTVIALFPIISNTTIGLRSVDPGLLAYFRMNKVGRAADAVAAADTECVAVLHGRAADFQRAGVDRRGGGGIRRRNRRAQRRAGVRDFAVGLPAGYSADVRRAAADHGHGGALFGLMVGLHRVLLGHWHDSAVKTES